MNDALRTSHREVVSCTDFIFQNVICVASVLYSVNNSIFMSLRCTVLTRRTFDAFNEHFSLYYIGF